MRPRLIASTIGSLIPLIFVVGCDSIDRANISKVLPLVEGCYARNGERIFQIEGAEFRQNRTTIAKIHGSRNGKSYDYLSVSTEFHYDESQLRLVYGRKISNASVGYYDRDGNISIRLTSSRGKVFIFDKVDCQS